MPIKPANKRTPNKKSKKPLKRAPREGQNKLQCDPLGCEFIVEGYMAEHKVSKAEAVRRMIWQWYWLAGEPDRPVIIIETSDPANNEERKARKSLINHLGTANNTLHKIRDALRRYSTELHDQADALRVVKALDRLADRYSDLYNEARAGIVPYLHIIPPEVIVEALQIEARGESTVRTKLVLASIFRQGGEQ